MQHKAFEFFTSTRPVRDNLLKVYSDIVREQKSLLPKGYGSKGFDRNKLWVGERDRRLEATEERAIRSVLADKKEALLFDMALETAMRLSEMFTLKTEDIDLKNRTIFLHRSRIYERTGLSDLEVASITGHKGFRMLQQYANLRGSTLATRLW